mgnify:CR=1 FL=1
MTTLDKQRVKVGHFHVIYSFLKCPAEVDTETMFVVFGALRSQNSNQPEWQLINYNSEC